MASANERQPHHAVYAMRIGMTKCVMIVATDPHGGMGAVGFCQTHQAYLSSGLCHEARIGELVDALDRVQSASKRLTDNINEFGHVTDDVFVDDVERAGIAARDILKDA